MFARRLTLLGGAMMFATLILAGQLTRLTVLQGGQHRAEAERILSTRKLLPTVRGSIYDSKGRILAEDRPCFDISVDYNVITGEWAYDKARLLARRDRRAEWARISFDEREAIIQQYRGPFDAQLNLLWAAIREYGNLTEQELTARREAIVTEVQMIRADFWDRRAKQREAEIGLPVQLGEVIAPVAEEQSAHAILSAVSDETAYRFRKIAQKVPGLKVTPSRTRWYPSQSMEVTLSHARTPSPLRHLPEFTTRIEALGTQIVGVMHTVSDEDLKARPFHRPGSAPDLAGYLAPDMKGMYGIEQAEEKRLRGSRGQLLTQKDTQIETRQPPQRGQDVHLTIDVALQARIRGLLDPEFGLLKVQGWHANHTVPTGTPLTGSVVVMEVDTGAVLAMVSTPTPPPYVPGETYPNLAGDPDRPMLNRCVGGAYPPGSTFKPIVYCIAATQKSIEWNQVIDCKGHLYPNSPSNHRCWIYRDAYGYQSHGPLPPAEAIARSCNIYFYTCGQKLGPEPLVEGLGQWGFGKSIGIGMPGETSGILPSLTQRNAPGRALSQSNAIQMGIGQGPVSASPLQIAAAHAALARGGYYLTPLLIRQRAGRQEGHDLGLPPQVIANALEGMWESANEKFGTGHELATETGREPILTYVRENPDTLVRSKTGTAQAPTQFQDVNNNGKRDEGEPVIRSGDHSWYVCHVQIKSEDRARFVIVCMVEFGGSGGKVSGPLVNQVLYALKDEGYL